MDTKTRFQAHEDPQVDRIREAMGAIAAASPAIFWLYRSGDELWCVRREGALDEQKFASHDAALSFMQVEAARCSSYRLFVIGTDGRVREQSFNWPVRNAHLDSPAGD